MLELSGRPSLKPWSLSSRLSLFFLGLKISRRSLFGVFLGLPEVADVKYVPYLWKNREKTGIDTSEKVYKTFIVNKTIPCKR